MVTLKIQNDYSWVLTKDEDLKKELWLGLRKREKGYFHSTLYKQGIWDGFVEFFHRDGGRFLTGLLPEVLRVLKSHKIIPEIVDTREFFEWKYKKVGPKFLREFQPDDEQFDLYDYQIDAINSVIRNYRGIVKYPTGAGKAQPLDSIVYTPTGPKKMGDINVGDIVCTPSGETTQVTGVYPQGNKDVYEIIFTNGDSVQSCKEHLWKIDAIMDEWTNKVKNTEYLIENLKSPSGRPKYAIKTGVLKFKKQKVLIEPYLMGALIGDGCLSKSSIKLSTVDEQLLQTVSSAIKSTYSFKKDTSVRVDGRKNCDYRLTKINRSKNPNIYLDAIREYNLAGKKSYDKFIPDQYKYNSLSTRWRLIQGLMDTDGYVDKRGRLEFCTTSKNLSEDFKEVAESVGGLCHVREKTPTYTYKGEKLFGRVAYTVSISHLKSEKFFNLIRKKNRCKKRSLYGTRRVISDIKYIGKKECQCIMVSHEDHMYVTDHAIPTHNTAIMCGIMKSLPDKCPVLFLTKGASLVDQNYKEMVKWGVPNVGRVYGKYKEPNFITCATTNKQTLMKLKNLLPKYKVLIVDEVHDCMSTIPKTAYKKLSGCVARIGISATPFKHGGKDVTQKFYTKGFFGPILKTRTTKTGVITTNDLQKRNILSGSECHFFRVEQPKLIHEPYIDAVTMGIAENIVLLDMVKKLALSLKGRNLILVDRIAQGEALEQMIPNSHWISGPTQLDERGEVFQKLKYDDNATAIVMQQIVSAGINVFVHNLINAAGGKAIHSIIQRMGRGLRRAGDKDILKYYDFIFDINDYLYKHSMQRIETLEGEGHKIIRHDKFNI